MNYITINAQDLASYAQIIIAAIAIISLFISIKSSKEVSKALQIIQSNIVNYTEPILKVVSFNFYAEKQENVSCTNPPTGISVQIQNVSSIAAEVTSTELNLYYGEEPLNKTVHKIGKDKIKSILVSGETTEIGTIQKDKLTEYMSKPKAYLSAVRLWFEVTVHFSNLKTKTKFKYYTKQEIYFDCSNIAMTQRVPIDEEIISI